MADAENIQLQLHLAPMEPIEVGELTSALSSLSRQYQIYVAREMTLAKGTEAKLLVSSVAPGSIDIGLLPILHQIAPPVQDALATAAPVVSQLGVVTSFAKHVKGLIDVFGGKKKAEASEPADISVRDCEDAINIVRPVAEHGGSQTFNVFQGPAVQQIFQVSAPEARAIIESANKTKAELQFPEAERRQRVPLIWSRLDRNPAKQAGSSPDKAIIDEIDPRPKSVFFADEYAYLKRAMTEDDDKPFQTMYFVDVEVSRVAGRVVSYRVVGFHGSDRFEGDEATDSNTDV